MKLTLQNFGRLREATVDLDKDLIILTGPNNTSKTYVAHAIYGLVSNSFRYVLRAVDDSLDGFFSKNSKSEEPIKIDVVEFVEKRFPRCLERLNQYFHAELADILACDAEFTARAELKIESSGPYAVFEMLPILDESDAARARQILLGMSFQMHNLANSQTKTAGSPVITFERSVSTSTLDGADTKSADIPLNGYAWFSLSQFLYMILRGNQTFSAAHILTAERAAIQLFSRELSLKRSELVDELLKIEGTLSQKADSNASLGKALGQRARRYPLAIRDSLRMSNDLATLRKTTSSFAPLADELERELLGGSIRTDDEGEVLFHPDGSESRLGLHLASSSVKALAGLSFFLRHIATAGQFLIIDEPELNLHPDNQRRVARVLARIARSGIKVLVSTHSDYFIRELNNIIMLSADTEGSVRERLGYDAEETLSPNQVGAYLFNSERAEPIEIKPTGIEVATIDREINALNNTSQDIYFSLFDKAGT